MSETLVKTKTAAIDGSAHVKSLISKAAATNDSADAMRFSQAAVNAANSLCALATAEKMK